MDNQELLALIDGDPIATEKAKIGDDVACAERCSIIAPQIRVPVNAYDLQREAMLSGSWGTMRVKATDTTVPDLIRALCHQFIDQVQSGSTIDFTLPQVQQMLGSMVSTGIVSQLTADAILAKSWAPQTITANDVSAAMSPRRPGGRI